MTPTQRSTRRDGHPETTIRIATDQMQRLSNQFLFTKQEGGGPQITSGTKRRRLCLAHTQTNDADCNPDEGSSLGYVVAHGRTINAQPWVGSGTLVTVGTPTPTRSMSPCSTAS